MKQLIADFHDKNSLLSPGGMSTAQAARKDRYNQECSLQRATVITPDKEEQLETESGHIHILPAWLWDLSLRDSVI